MNPVTSNYSQSSEISGKQNINMNLSVQSHINQSGQPLQLKSKWNQNSSQNSSNLDTLQQSNDQSLPNQSQYNSISSSHSFINQSAVTRSTNNLHINHLIDSDNHDTTKGLAWWQKIPMSYNFANGTAILNHYYSPQNSTATNMKNMKMMNSK